MLSLKQQEIEGEARVLAGRDTYLNARPIFWFFNCVLCGAWQAVYWALWLIVSWTI